jgi:hypothetical protein
MGGWLEYSRLLNFVIWIPYGHMRMRHHSYNPFHKSTTSVPGLLSLGFGSDVSACRVY